MTRLSETIEVPRPLAEAFDYTANFAHIEQWDPGVSESERLDSGPLGVDSEFRVVIKSGPRRVPMTYVVREFEPPNRILLEGEGETVHALDEIRFSATGAGTRIEYTADIRLKGLAGVVQPLLGLVLDRVGKRAMAGLRQALSENPPVPGPSAWRNLADRLVLPGALGFTRFGYAWRKPGWKPLAVSLADRTVVITGATAGLGRVTAERLAELGARVVLVGRNPDKVARVVAEVTRTTGNSFVRGEVADLALMAEVRSLARRLLDREPQIHVLINNAAVLPGERTFTDKGLETAFATDLLSPYLLTTLMLPRLRASAPARVVNVSSGGMYLAGVDVDDLQNERGEYDGSRAYARAKRGLMILTERWAQELEGSGVVVNAMHPGWADTPGVQTSLPGFRRAMKAVLRSPEEGADTIVWLAAATEAGQVSGRFWLDREPHEAAIFPGTAGTEAERDALVAALERLARGRGKRRKHAA